MQLNALRSASSSSSSLPQFANILEGVQYQFFCGDAFFSLRILETGSAQFLGLWMFEGESRQLLSRFEKLERADTVHLDLRGDAFHIEVGETGGSIRARTQEGLFEADFTSPFNLSWTIPPDDVVIHQVLIKATVRIAGRKYEGYGYCKRYWYGGNVDYLNWRLISGPIRRDGETAHFWTVESNMDFHKYDYFKLVTSDGSVSSSSPNESRHRQLKAFGAINGVLCEASVRPIGAWTWKIRKNQTDSTIQEAFCELTFNESGKISNGYALHELGAGVGR